MEEATFASYSRRLGRVLHVLQEGGVVLLGRRRRRRLPRRRRGGLAAGAAAAAAAVFAAMKLDLCVCVGTGWEKSLLSRYTVRVLSTGCVVHTYTYRVAPQVAHRYRQHN